MTVKETQSKSAGPGGHHGPSPRPALSDTDLRVGDAIIADNTIWFRDPDTAPPQDGEVADRNDTQDDADLSKEGLEVLDEGTPLSQQEKSPLVVEHDKNINNSSGIGRGFDMYPPLSDEPPSPVAIATLPALTDNDGEEEDHMMQPPTPTSDNDGSAVPKTSEQLDSILNSTSNIDSKDLVSDDDDREDEDKGVDKNEYENDEKTHQPNDNDTPVATDKITRRHPVDVNDETKSLVTVVEHTKIGDDLTAAVDINDNLLSRRLASFMRGLGYIIAVLLGFIIVVLGFVCAAVFFKLKTDETKASFD